MYAYNIYLRAPMLYLHITNDIFARAPMLTSKWKVLRL